MQDVSITVLNVTLNDSGIYTCNITREFEFEIHRPLFQSSRLIHLTVVEEGRKGCQKVLCAVTGRGCCHPLVEFVTAPQERALSLSVTNAGLRRENLSLV